MSGWFSRRTLTRSAVLPGSLPLEQLLAVLACAVLLFPGPGCAAAAYTLYGYEDEYGIVHLHEEPVTENHILLYEGAERPRLGLDDIRRLIRQRGAASASRNEAWIKEHVKAWKPRRFISPKSRGAPGKELLEAIKATAQRHDLDPDLVYAVMEQESGFQPKAVSPKGAKGLMQLMPATQKALGLEDPFDPEGNLEAGARYLRQLLTRFKTLRLALAAYNAGPGAVERYRGVPPYSETRLYVQTVLARYRMLQSR